MKVRNISRSAVLGTAIVILALARVTVVPSIGGDAAWVLNHIIQTAGLVCCLAWWWDWKQARAGGKEEKGDSHDE